MRGPPASFAIPFLAILLLSAFAPVASAQTAVVRVDDVRGPDLIVPGFDFDLDLTLRNTANERQSGSLSAALYKHDPNQVCGSHQDSRFKGFIHRTNVVVTMQPRETKDYPAEGGVPWRMHLPMGRVSEGGQYQICVFLMKSQTPVEYHDFGLLNLTLRLTNAPPQVDFSWDPVIGNVTTEYVFRATASDPDEDEVTLRWDFGRLGFGGAEGEVATQRFFSSSSEPRTYLVNLTAFDGFETTRVSKELTVYPEDVPAQRVKESDPETGFFTPAPSFALLAGAGVAVAVALAHMRRATR